MNILERANDIIANKSEEKERQYGNINDAMRAQEVIYDEIYNPDDDKVVMGFKRMLALKIARTRIYAREDTLLDLVAYAGAFNDYLRKDD
ncbi:MAG: hypothetical protein KAH32_04580 [Chlamydiia bacterium]|nr:hypothetical protein [Chlamydiia bacterium]